MKKTTFLSAVILSFSFYSASGQTIFTYGKYAVSAKEFEKAFEKNNPDTSGNRAKAKQEYLDLFINSKLKIQEAYNRGYDTSSSFKQEIASLRSQILPNYLNDEESIDKLVKEAHARSLKDIRLSHIFIPFAADGNNETNAAAEKNINAAYKELKKRKKFEQVAVAYSKDPSVTNNKGDIGFITVFTLPYELETEAYNTPAGKFSKPFKSEIGWHIFKVTGERQAIGRMKAAQILFAYPPGATDEGKKKIKELAATVYAKLQSGEDFAKLAKEYSNDYVTASNGGNLPEFGTGVYDAAFEKNAFALEKDGDITAPFESEFGYHIVKRIVRTPTPATLANEEDYSKLKTKVESDPRKETTNEILYQKIIKQAGYTASNYNTEDLWKLTDSLIDKKQVNKNLSVNTNTPLFKVGSRQITALDWIGFAQSNRYKPNGAGVKLYPETMNDFKHYIATEYYKENLENFNPNFRNQMTEFKDGNLFFEIMMQDVWSKAQNDSTGQMDYYKQNKASYKWGQSADAVIFYCLDNNTAKELKSKITENKNWPEVMTNYTDRVTPDSGRFEYAQIPGLTNSNAAKGTVTDIQQTDNDAASSFALILDIHTQPGQKAFADAKGAVINDYQNELDKKWITELRKKYPVKVNEEVVKSLLN